MVGGEHTWRPARAPALSHVSAGNSAPIRRFLSAIGLCSTFTLMSVNAAWKLTWDMNPKSTSSRCLPLWALNYLYIVYIVGYNEVFDICYLFFVLEFVSEEICIGFVYLQSLCSCCDSVFNVVSRIDQSSWC